MIPFDKCPICGIEVIEKEVEKLSRGGKNTAIIKVSAEVCLNCGERLYSKETINIFERICSKLERQDVSEFEPLGYTYKVAV